MPLPIREGRWHTAVRLKRWEFVLVVAPLPVPGPQTA